MTVKPVAAAVAAAMLLWSPAPAAAQNGGALTSTVELEKVMATNGQPPVKSYSAPDVVVPGDRVRVTLRFTNRGAAPAAGVNITNPIPEGLVFDGTDDSQDFAVSVDQGKSFGALAALTVPVAGAAPRAATASDVTQVRWLWSTPVPAGQTRSVAFFGKVK